RALHRAPPGRAADPLPRAARRRRFADTSAGAHDGRRVHEAGRRVPARGARRRTAVARARPADRRHAVRRHAAGTGRAARAARRRTRGRRGRARDLRAAARRTARGSRVNAAVPRGAKLRRRLWTLLLVLLVGAAAAFALPRLLYGPLVPAVPVVQREFVQSVVASGRVQTPHRVEIGSQITGTVVRVPVAEGQDVRAGEVLVELDDTELRAAVEQ